MSTTRFVPGDGTLVVTGAAVALVGAGVGHPLVQLIEQALPGTSVIDAVAELLADPAQDPAPAFALAVRDGNRVRLVVRGAASARAEVDGTPSTCSGLGVATWREQAVTRPSSVALTLATGAPTGRPVQAHWISDGVVPAASAEWIIRDHLLARRTNPLVETVIDLAPPASSNRLPDPSATLMAPETDGGVGTGVGVTVHRPILEAAPVAPTVITPVPVPLPPPAIPSLGAPVNDLDGYTVARKRPHRHESTSGLPAPRPPLVGAVFCANAHANPPVASSCRQCGQAITDRAPVPVERPPLGELAFTDGRRIVVTGPLVVGRMPPSDRLIDGEPAGQITIHDGEVSRLHVAIHVGEWSVSVADQGSSNGTTVRLPGRSPRILRPYKQVELEPGTRIELGAASAFTFSREVL